MYTNFSIINNTCEDFDIIEDFHRFVKVIEDACLIKIIHLNIRSLKSNIVEFDHFLRLIPGKIDIIILSECWLTSSELYENYFEDYGFIISSKTNKAGGVAIFYRKDTVNVIDCEYDCIDNADSVAITFDCNSLKNQTLLSVYRSPSQDAHPFISSIQNWLNKRVKNINKFAIVGDINLCRKKYQTNLQVEELYDSIIEEGLIPTINTETRIAPNTQGSLIDQVFVSLNTLLKNGENFSGNIDVNITDHKLQYLFITSKTNKMTKQAERPLVRIYNQKNKDSFIKRMEKLQLQDFNTSDDIDFIYNEFQRQLQCVFDESFPLMRLSRKKVKCKPWFNPDCNRALHRKTKMFKKYLQTLTADDKSKYEASKKQYKKITNKAKEVYHKSLFEGCKKSVKATWKMINMFLGKSKCDGHVKLNINNQITDNNRDIANIFNKHFNEVGSTYGHEPLSGNDFAKYMPQRAMRSFFFKDITLQETRCILKQMDHDKSTYDEIPLRIFKMCPDHVLDFLTNLINKVLKGGKMPTALKRSLIIPVHKRGSKLEVNNYRPISLLSYIDKLIEKAMCTRLYDYLNQSEAINPNQFGFRENHSTELALLSVMERVYEAIETKKNLLFLTIDLRKAFEVIRHDILLAKLENLGIRGTILDWFESYLSNRKHQTKVNDTLSNTLKVKTGVPEGSSLGPLLFLIYINDMQNIFQENELTIFADDTTLVLSHEDTQELYKYANLKLIELDQYLKANGVQLNDQKTEYMFISARGKRAEVKPCVLYDKKKLKEVEYIKLLGVFIDKKLNFCKHTERLINNKLKNSYLYSLN